MPLYEFQCKKCEEIYEEFSSYDATGKYPEVKCPKCGSKKKTRLMGAPSFNFSNPEGTKRWNSDSTGHDYRYKHKVPQIKSEREHAEKHSHMGPKPYGE
jgi:putative FmdB family regulatory protein